jgi:hypothetical protein
MSIEQLHEQIKGMLLCVAFSTSVDLQKGALLWSHGSGNRGGSVEA